MYSSKQVTLYCQDYFSSPLTSMQQFMLDDEGAVRRPYLCKLASHIQFDEFNKTLYEAISNHILLQIRVFINSKTGQAYQQYQPLPPIEKWTIEHEEICMPPDQYIENVEQPIAVLEGYPWRIKYFTYNKERYLYVEFHQLCIDEFGVKSFENSLFDVINHRYRSFSGHLSSMKLATNMEMLAKSRSTFSLRVIDLLKRGSKSTTKDTKKLEIELSETQIELVQHIALQHDMDMQVVYQLLTEHALGWEYEGQAYGMLDNLRSTVGNYDEAGCFTYMVKQHIHSLHAMRSRLFTLHMQRNERKQGDITLQPVHNTVQIVYSFEEVLCKHLQEIELSGSSSYPLSIKVKQSTERTKICIQYQEGRYDEIQINRILDRFKLAIRILYRQLCIDHATLIG